MVEMDGDEMTRIIWQFIKEKVPPFPRWVASGWSVPQGIRSPRVPRFPGGQRSSVFTFCPALLMLTTFEAVSSWSSAKACPVQSGPLAGAEMCKLFKSCSSFFWKRFITLVCWRARGCHGAHVEARNLSIPSHRVSPRDQTQIVRLGSKCLYPRSHLSVPSLFLFKRKRT